MIHFQAFNIRFSLPLPVLLMPFLAKRLGMADSMRYLCAALCIHECAHLLAAKWMHVTIREIRILPFGGSAKMENPYGLTAGRLIPTAIAGPAANFLLAICMAALAQWKLIHPNAAASHVKINLILMLFNLLPALPLDGGRILYAALAPRMGEVRALRLGVFCGRALAALLILLAVVSGLRSGKWNLSFLLAAVFIFSSGADESSALNRSRAERLEQALQDVSQTRPARIYQVDEQTSLHEALRLLRPRESAWFILMRNGIPGSLVDGSSLLSAILKGCAADMPLCRLKGFTMRRTSAADT